MQQSWDTGCIPKVPQAELAQLVERRLPKPQVTSSNLAFRSDFCGFICFIEKFFIPLQKKQINYKDMNDWHNKIMKLDLTKWVVTKFYHYASICQDIFAEYDEVWNNKPVGDPYIKELYIHFLSIANLYYKEYTGRKYSDIRDNKTTIEITNVETGEKLYITSKDGRFLIGKSVWSEFGIVTNFGICQYESKIDKK